ncbi:MAG: RNA repair transcriptional activator RtcR [Myxococcota bacterium]
MGGIVVLGFHGMQLDAGAGPRRWERWRPTVSLFQRDDLAIARLDLLCQRVEHAATIAADVRRLSPETEVVLHPLPLRDPWDFEEVYGALHDFVRTYPFRPDDEEYQVHITTGTHVAQICWFLLTESRFVPGRLLQTGPPRDGDPTGTIAVIDLDLARYDRIATRFAREQVLATDALKSGISTRDRSFNALIDRIERVAVGSTAPILLTGPTGAGKSQLARRIYELKRSRRQLDGPLVEVNCATLRGDAATSALFGHRKGAFTGAVADRPGLLLAANDGLLFLDEIGELGPDEQAMLLRAIEDHTFLPVGSDREVTSRFQLIAGTNRDLRDHVAAGKFREDLLARIDLWSFRLPGLRERLDDVEPNLDYELEQFARTAGRRVSFNREARDRFVRFATGADAAWRANFRDLNAAVVRMATLSPSGRIGPAEVDDEIDRLRASWAIGSTADRVRAVLGDAADGLDRFDRVQLNDVLAVCAGSRTLSDAGRTLFAASRARRTSVNDADRLRKYLARFGLGWDPYSAVNVTVTETGGSSGSPSANSS